MMDYKNQYDLEKKNIKMECDDGYSINIQDSHCRTEKDIKLVQKNQIKCEKKCFDIVDKWTAKVLVKLPVESDFNKIIEREIALFKVKYPFLPKKQLKGKVLIKFGIPTLMGNIIRTGPGTITKVAAWKLSTPKIKGIRTQFNAFKTIIPYLKYPKTFDNMSNKENFSKILTRTIKKTNSPVIQENKNIKVTPERNNTIYRNRKRPLTEINSKNTSEFNESNTGLPEKEIKWKNIISAEIPIHSCSQHENGNSVIKSCNIKAEMSQRNIKSIKTYQECSPITLININCDSINFNNIEENNIQCYSECSTSIMSKRELIASSDFVWPNYTNDHNGNIHNNNSADELNLQKKKAITLLNNSQHNTFTNFSSSNEEVDKNNTSASDQQITDLNSNLLTGLYSESYLSNNIVMVDVSHDTNENINNKNNVILPNTIQELNGHVSFFNTSQDREKIIYFPNLPGENDKSWSSISVNEENICHLATIVNNNQLANTLEESLSTAYQIFEISKITSEHSYSIKNSLNNIDCTSTTHSSLPETLYNIDSMNTMWLQKSSQDLSHEGMKKMSSSDITILNSSLTSDILKNTLSPPVTSKYSPESNKSFNLKSPSHSAFDMEISPLNSDPHKTNSQYLLSNVCSEYDREEEKAKCTPKIFIFSKQWRNSSKNMEIADIQELIRRIIEFLDQNLSS